MQSVIRNSYSDNDVMILRPEVTILLHENLCTLISSNVTFNRVDNKGDHWVHHESCEEYEWSRWNLTLLYIRGDIHRSLDLVGLWNAWSCSNIDLFHIVYSLIKKTQIKLWRVWHIPCLEFNLGYKVKRIKLHRNIGHEKVVSNHRSYYYLGSSDALLDAAHCL